MISFRREGVPARNCVIRPAACNAVAKSAGIGRTREAASRVKITLTMSPISRPAGRRMSPFR